MALKQSQVKAPVRPIIDGNILRMMRRENGLTVAELAFLVGMSQVTLRNWEANKFTSGPRLDLYCALCVVLGLELEDLVDMESVRSIIRANLERARQEQVNFAANFNRQWMLAGTEQHVIGPLNKTRAVGERGPYKKPTPDDDPETWGANGDDDPDDEEGDELDSWEDTDDATEDADAI